MDRRKRPQLSIKQVEAATTKGGALHMLSDGLSLYLQIRKDGTKHWVVKYKEPSSRCQRNEWIGSWPTVSAEKARLLRDRVLKMVKLGVDPSNYKKTGYTLTSDIDQKLQVIDYTHELIYTKRMIF